MEQQTKQSEKIIQKKISLDHLLKQLRAKTVVASFLNDVVISFYIMLVMYPHLNHLINKSLSVYQEQLLQMDASEIDDIKTKLLSMSQNLTITMVIFFFIFHILTYFAFYRWQKEWAYKYILTLSTSGTLLSAIFLVILILNGPYSELYLAILPIAYAFATTCLYRHTNLKKLISA
ncbi:MAG: hypothetical protein HQK53_04795 [Oligoflexia bacterium]|nr:hypothetical protein [Oligoflexia bacterium]